MIIPGLTNPLGGMPANPFNNSSSASSGFDGSTFNVQAPRLEISAHEPSMVEEYMPNWVILGFGAIAIFALLKRG